jgi:CCR4-NOT transcriptional regulation complex NOT5 subunit
MFFKPGIENIRNNLGPESVTDDHITNMCRQILEEAKRMYPVFGGNNASSSSSSSSPSSSVGNTNSSSAMDSSNNESEQPYNVQQQVSSVHAQQQQSQSVNQTVAATNSVDSVKLPLTVGWEKG